MAFRDRPALIDDFDDLDEVKEIHLLRIGLHQLDHEASTSCWCEPELTYRNEYTRKEIWTHKWVH